MDCNNFPFIFNPFKHHIGWLRRLLAEDASRLDYYMENYFLKGNNLLSDYYFGPLGIDQVISEIKTQLLGMDVLEKNDYLAWIDNSPGKYQLVSLSDQSTWTLLKGEEKYIHIHPARSSKHTIRVRMLTLKTVLLYKWLYNKEKPDTVIVNSIRTKYLKESPVKNVGGHFIRFYMLLNDHIT